MLAPAAIGLVISLIFLNFSLLVKGVFLMPNRGEPAEIGKVLGAAENSSEASISTEQRNNFKKTIVKVIEEARVFPAPRFFQLPRLDQPMRQTTKEQEEKPRPVITDYDFSAQNGAILDYDDSLFFAKRPDRAWPIASITKLFTAFTFLDFNPGWDKIYTIKAEDKREGGKIYLFTGDKITVKDLFYFSLVGSDNTATQALVMATGLSETEFVEKMNGKIKELGLKNTRLVDPAGLNDGNISTAREIAIFAKIALANQDISRASLTKAYKFNTEQGREKSIVNTNELLNNFPNQGISILGGKTGHINSSGYCLVSQFKSYEGRPIIIVILGAEKDSDRFGLTKKLVSLYYNGRP